MNGFKIALIVLMALGAILTVASVGKRREPVTPAVAVVTLLLTGIEVLLVVLA